MLLSEVQMKHRTSESPAVCATCGKTFARSDSLLRHKKSRHAGEDGASVERVTGRTFRACFQCAQARTRCSGCSPCRRCTTRNVACTFPSVQWEDSAVDTESPRRGTTEAANRRQYSQPRLSHQQQPGQQQQLQSVDPNGAAYSGDGRLGLSGPILSSGRAHGDLGLGSAGSQSLADLNRTSSGSDPMQAPSEVASHELQPAEYTQPAMPIDYQNMLADPPTDFAYDTTFDESLNLNWIPLSVYPWSYSGMEQDVSFLMPSLYDHAGLDYSSTAGQVATTTTQAASGCSTGAQMQSQAPDHQVQLSALGLAQRPISSTGSNVDASKGAYGEAGATEHKRKRRKFSHPARDFYPPEVMPNEFAFADPANLAELRSSMPRTTCSESDYSRIASEFDQLCIHSSQWPQFTNRTFPDIATVNACIDLYFEYFHSTFPILHAATFASDANWLVILATAAIGGTFASVQNTAALRQPFQEFLRRAIVRYSENEDGDFLNLHLAQARILNLVGLAQSDREGLRSMAARYHADLARWCLQSGLLQRAEPDEQINGDGLSSEHLSVFWKAWIHQESLRRVGYFIWLLDISVGYLCNARPLCNMDDARAPLPCAEALWNATSTQQWNAQKSAIPTMPSLYDALEQVYVKKKIDAHMSDTSQILLIHALYSRTWEIGTHVKQPLSEWKATGTTRGFLTTPVKDDFWLPLYPLYANWRNSACDCLDILSWHASSVVAEAFGAEHHGVLHLHLARLILLTPFQEIQDLLFSLINYKVETSFKASFYVHDGSFQPRNLAKGPQTRKIVWRWLREDQHKARLAMIHAGSVFWHVRRHSNHSFYEPLAVYLASLLLWTYASYKSAALERDTVDASRQDGSHGNPKPPDNFDANFQGTFADPAAQSPTNSRPGSQSSPPHRHERTDEHHQMPTHGIADNTPDDNLSDSASSVEDKEPSFIHLDRPCDDEMVQYFVRNGDNMAGYISNVGDICKAPHRVLIEGSKLLRTKLSCWGVSREYYDILVRLAGIRGDASGAGPGRRMAV